MARPAPNPRGRLSSLCEEGPQWNLGDSGDMCTGQTGLKGMKSPRNKAAQAFRRRTSTAPVAKTDHRKSLINTVMRHGRTNAANSDSEGSPSSDVLTDPGSADGKHKERDNSVLDLSLSLQKYLPTAVLAHLRQCSVIDYHVWHTYGAAIFFDLSGFTQATEELSRSEDGAEQISAILNTCFMEILPIIRDMRGDVVSFSGDAVLAVWLCKPSTMQRSTALALQCCVRLLDSFRQYCVSSGSVELRPHIGLGCGPCTAAIVGAGHTWRYIVVGQAVKNAAFCSTLAQPGQLTMCQNTYRLCIARCRVTKLRAELSTEADPCTVYRFDETLEDTATTSSGAPTPESLSPEASLMEEEIPPGKLELAKQFLFRLMWRSPADCVGQLRTVSTLFVQLYPRDVAPDEVDTIQRAFRTLLQALKHFHGVCNKCVLDDKGLVALCIFGLPHHTRDNDATRSVMFAFHLRTKLRKVVGTSRIGVSRSVAFCGNVGAPWRMEYTVLGQGVNLAARLMTHGRYTRGEEDSVILCDRETFLCASQAPGSQIVFRGPIHAQVKGYANRVEVYEPTSVQLIKAEASPMMGPVSSMSSVPNAVEAFAPLDLMPTVSQGTTAGLGAGTPSLHHLSLISQLPGSSVMYPVACLSPRASGQLAACVADVVLSPADVANIQAFLHCTAQGIPGRDANPDATPRVLVISGDTGTGKSTVLKMVTRLADDLSVAWMMFSVPESDAGAMPYSGVRPIFEKFFETGEDGGAAASPDASQPGVAHLLAGLPAKLLAQMPLLLDVYPDLESCLAAHLDLSADRRYRLLSGEELLGVNEQVEDLLVPLAGAFFRHSAFIVCIDNAQHLDAQSVQLLARLLAAVPYAGLALAGKEYQMSPDDSYCCAASTASDAPWALLAQLRPTFIHLDGLGLEQTTQLCGRLLGARTVDAGLAGQVHTLSGGHPRFIQDIVMAWREQRAIAVAEGHATLQEGGRTLALPRAILDFVTSTIDRLPRDLTSYLKLASVIGETFRISTLLKCSGDAVEDAYLAISSLERHNFIVEAPREDLTMDIPLIKEPSRTSPRSPQLHETHLRSCSSDEGDDLVGPLQGFVFGRQLSPRPSADFEAKAYRFKMHSSRDVIYGMLLFCERKDMHRTVAQALLQEGETDHALVAHHCIKCEDFALANQYLEMHLEEALTAGRWTKCQEALHTIAGIPEQDSPRSSRSPLPLPSQRLGQFELLSQECCLQLGLPAICIPPLYRAEEELEVNVWEGLHGVQRRLLWHTMRHLVLRLGSWLGRQPAPAPACEPLRLTPVGSSLGTHSVTARDSRMCSPAVTRRKQSVQLSPRRSPAPPYRSRQVSSSSSASSRMSLAGHRQSLSNRPRRTSSARRLSEQVDRATPLRRLAHRSSSARALTPGRHMSPPRAEERNHHRLSVCSGGEPSSVDSRPSVSVRVCQGLLQMESLPPQDAPPLDLVEGNSPSHSPVRPSLRGPQDRLARTLALLCRDYHNSDDRGAALLLAVMALNAVRDCRGCGTRSHVFGAALLVFDAVGWGYFARGCLRQLTLAGVHTAACQSARHSSVLIHCLTHRDMDLLRSLLPQALEAARGTPNTIG
eukprot:EG_transcript_301